MKTTPVFMEAVDVSIAFPAPAHLKGQAEGIGGRFRKYAGRTQLLAVDGVSLRLEPGDSLGLIGRNGSGKTTLLRLLANILHPSSGSVIHSGRLGNALNINLGFRNEATGRHNIRLKALIAGCSSKDVPAITEDVEAFAELGPFLDMPMNSYSAGMRARLAFGLATAFDYDILIMDEWLGAGDRSMQDAVKKRMGEFVSRSSIIVLASHSPALLKNVCNKGLMMDHGRAVFQGDIEDALDYYDEFVVTA